MEIEHYYPLERILILAKQYEGETLNLLNNFQDFYENLEVKPPINNNFKKNFNKNGYGWRRKCRFKSRDLEKFMKQKYEKNVPQTDDERIRRMIISHLNKLNESKFTIIVKEFIDDLEEVKFIELYDILCDEILNKVELDNHYVYLYAKLVHELIINKKWQKNIINVLKSENGIYWTYNRISEEEEEFVGPFDDEKECYDDALNQKSFEHIFINFMQNKFVNRGTYLSEINKSKDTYDVNHYHKQRYTNFLNFIYQNVVHKILKEGILHHCLIQLLENNDIESFVILYSSIKNVSMSVKNVYSGKVKKFMDMGEVNIKVKFKLQDLFGFEVNTNNRFEKLMVESTESDVSEENTSDNREVIGLFNEYLNMEGEEDVLKVLGRIEGNEELVVNMIENLLTCRKQDLDSYFELVRILFELREGFRGDFKVVFLRDILKNYSDYVVEYPNARKIFERIFTLWGEEIVRDDLVNLLESEDEDEKFSVEEFISHFKI